MIAYFADEECLSNGVDYWLGADYQRSTWYCGAVNLQKRDYMHVDTMVYEVTKI